MITDEQREAFGAALYEEGERDELPEAAQLASPRLRQSDRGRRAQRGRDRSRPRLRRRHRRAALGAAGRPDRQRLRPRHDRRDARAGAAQPARGRSRERRVPQGHDRGDAAPRRLGRRDHLQLRDQPLRRQAGGLPRGGAGAAPGRALRGQRRRRRPRDGRGDPARHAAVDRLHRRRADRATSSASSSRPPASRTSRSARPIGSTSTPPRRSFAPGSAARA